MSGKLGKRIVADSAAATLSHLVVPFSIKAVNDANGVRTFEGLAATWDQDLGNDVIAKGAFKDSIANWRNDKTVTVPLLDSHDQWSICSALGQMTDAKETTAGLWTSWELVSGDEGEQVYNRLKISPTTGRPIVGKLSIGYIPQEYSYEQPEGTEGYWDRIRHLSKVSLEEVSLVLFPMNPNASIDASSVKHMLSLAKHTDPQRLTKMDKLELRRLNTLIGKLLRKPKDDDAPDDETKGRPVVKTTTVVAPPKVAAPQKGAKDPSDDEDDLTDEEELVEDDIELESDDDDTDDLDDSTDDPSNDADETDESDDQDDAPEVEAPDDQKSGVYQFNEALQHRLKNLKLKALTSSVTHPSS